MSEFENVTCVLVRSGGGNRYVASYFAALKRLGFHVVSSLAHNHPQIQYAATYVFEHSTNEGVPRSVYDSVFTALAEKHIQKNHSKQYVESRSCTSEVWYHNQRIDYQNEIRAWPDEC